MLVSTGWLGMNDAWVGLGLCYLAFGRRMPLVIAACVVCPFIDERFVFGLPLALVVRNLESLRTGSSRALLHLAGQCLLAIAPFAAIRLVGIVGGRGAATDQVFLWTCLRESGAYLWMAPLGGWMAFRFAYLPVMRRTAELFVSDRLVACFLMSAALIPVTVGFLLASDTMRTAGILLPLCAWAAIESGKGGERSQLKWLAIASLVFTAAHVTHTKVLPINSLPVELWRVLR
ncbi:MAG TPA: hypothetical protein VMM36_09115 [Opitutaceae bacterium]|nr:hypothetical protein [Opitutaceae bacterium]